MENTTMKSEMAPMTYATHPSMRPRVVSPQPANVRLRADVRGTDRGITLPASGASWVAVDLTGRDGSQSIAQSGDKAASLFAGNAPITNTFMDVGSIRCGRPPV